MVSIYDEIKTCQQGFAIIKPTRIMRNGVLVRRHNWTEKEKEYIKVNYRHNKESVNQLMWKFGVTRRSLASILGKLGLTKSTKLWKPKQEAFLREYFDKIPTRRIARRLGKTEGAVRHKAQRFRLKKYERNGWFTLTEACGILGVTRDWLTKRLNNGFKFDIQPFDCERLPVNGGIHPCYISEKALCDFIRRYPEELAGHNIDIPVVVEILAGIKVDTYEQGLEEV